MDAKPFKVYIAALDEWREATFEEMRSDVLANLEPAMRLLQHLHNNRTPLTRGHVYEAMAAVGRVMNYFEKLEGPTSSAPYRLVDMSGSGEDSPRSDSMRLLNPP